MYHNSYFVLGFCLRLIPYKLMTNEQDNIKCTCRNKVSVRMEGVMEPSAYEPTLYPE